VHNPSIKAKLNAQLFADGKGAGQLLLQKELGLVANHFSRTVEGQ
jgi:hypothetical protein